MPELTDHNGRVVELPDDPKRIVSFSPAVTETLFELGLEREIIGVSAFCARPGKVSAKRRIGSYGSTPRDLLRELKPDLVLTVSGFQNDFALDLAKEFTVFTFELPSSVAGIVDLVSRIGLVTGRTSEARYMEFELMKYLGSIRRRPNITGYLEMDLGGPASFGSLSYITDALSILGVESIYGRVYSEWLKPDMGFVTESDPDVIFYEPKMYSKFQDRDLERIITERGWSGLKSVRNKSLFVTPGRLDFFAHHGPSFIREVLPWTMERVETI